MGCHQASLSSLLHVFFPSLAPSSCNTATLCSGCPRSISRSLDNARAAVLILLMMSGGKMLLENVNVAQHSVDGGSGFLAITQKNKKEKEFEEVLPVRMK